ncbi:MAG: acetate--CoA ligase family protein [Clostridia bacterium]
MNALDKLLYPDGVAVVGSASPGKLGAVLANRILEGGFANVYCINPKAQAVEGAKGFSAITGCAQKVDMVVIASPAATVANALRDAGRAGVGAAVIISSGFSEAGYHELETEVNQVAREFGIRYIGPNCAGLVNTACNLTATLEAAPQRGRVSIISQSGAIGGAFMAASTREGLGIGKFLSFGNGSDLNQNELLRYLAEDDDTDVIAMYIENVKNGHEFMEALSYAASKKPTAIIKSGRTEGGKRAALSHTGALAGADAIYDTAFAQCGAVRAASVEELIDVCKGMAINTQLHGNSVALITNSGGPGVLTADACDGLKLTTPAPDDALKAYLKGALPAFAGLSNPFDVTVEGTAEQYGMALAAALDTYDAAVVIYVGTPYLAALPVAEAVARSAKEANKPVTAYFEVGSDINQAIRLLNEAGVPCFTSGERAARALAGKCKLKVRERGGVNIAQKPLGLSVVLEPDAMRLLCAQGIPVPPHTLVKSGEEACEAAQKLGYPVCMKIVSKDIIHKSDVGGVKLGIGDAAAARRAFDELERVCAGKSFSGVLVYPMLKKGDELIIGLTRDPQFGPVVAFGMGGVYTEVFRDVALRIAPLSKDEAMDMIRSVKAYKLLAGARGSEKKDIDALADIICRLSELMFIYDEIDEVDLNPVFAYAHGAVVADARILLKK